MKIFSMLVKYVKMNITICSKLSVIYIALNIK